MGTTIEVREPNETPRSFEINGTAVVGRDDTAAIRLTDPTISRSHAQIAPVPGGLSVVDLDSSNGTWVAGVRSQPHAPFVVPVGGEVRFGDTVVVVHAAAPAASPPVESPSPSPAPLSPPRASGPPRPPVPPTTPSPPVPVAAAPQGRMLRREIDGAVIHSREGSVGERVAGAFAASFQRARRRLAGFGSEAWGVQVAVYLVDPFPDPGDADRLITSGSVVNARANEIWMAITAEAPPESPERALALLFGSVLPAAADLEHLIEGYGLFVADSADPDPLLRGNVLPPFEAAEGDLRAAMALSFVQFLVARGGREPFKRMLSTAQPGRVEAASEEQLGVSLGSLEDEWRMLLVSGQDKVKPTQFLRLSAQYLRPHTRRELELGFYMLLSLAFTMAFPFISKRLFDTAIPSGEFSQVVQLLAILGIAFVISLLAGLRQAYVGAYVSGAIVRDIRAAMFDRLQFLSYGWFARHQQGDILSRMFNDVALLERGISETLLQGVMQLLTLAVAAFVVLKLSPLLGIIVLLGAPAVAIVYRLMSNGAQKRSLAVQERQSALLAVAAENYSAQPVVKGFGLEDRERGRFGAALNRLFLSERKLSIFGGLFGLTVNLIVTALRLFVLGLGAYLVLHGEITLGTLVAFLGVMGEVIGPVTSLTGVGQQVQTATGALVRVNEVLDTEPDIADAPGAVAIPPLRQQLELRGVSFSYTPEKRTLSDVTLVIPQGSRVAFVGPSGAGKSSVMQLIMRNYEPDLGAVMLDGVDIRHVTLSSLREQMGVVFQDNFLFDTSIRENIRMGRPSATDEDIERAARAAEVHDFIAQLPRGYDTLVGERGGRLSGGQRQRVAIARALVRDPRILLLDEATSALDPRTERLINDTLERAAAGRTTIAVTHRLASVVDYDCIFVLSEGALVEQGRHADLLAEGGVYASLWAEQMGTAAAASAGVDVVTALRRVPLFVGLDDRGIEEVVAALSGLELFPEQRLQEGQNLYLLLRGQARVTVPGFEGASEQTFPLAPGDSFGLGAALGQPSGAELQAVDRLQLAVLDLAEIPRLAARLPAVAAALGGLGGPRPESGQILGRLTIGPRSSISAVPAAPAPVSLSEAVHQTGVLRPIR